MSGTWSKDPVWQVSAVPVPPGANIDSPNLSAYRELLVVIKGLALGVAADCMVQVGVGGVFDTTNYIHCGGVGTNGFIFCAPAAVGPSLIAGTIELLHFNLPTQTWGRIRAGREGSTSGQRFAPAYNTQATAWDCIRITNSGATPWTAINGISVFQKQP